jgi:hypothetical protein
LVVEDIGVANQKLNCFIQADHPFIPEYAAFSYLIILFSDGTEAERKRIKGVAPNPASRALLVVPAVEEPFVPTSSMLGVSQPSDLEIN